MTSFSTKEWKPYFLKNDGFTWFWFFQITANFWFDQSFKNIYVNENNGRSSTVCSMYYNAWRLFIEMNLFPMAVCSTASMWNQKRFSLKLKWIEDQSIDPRSVTNRGWGQTQKLRGETVAVQTQVPELSEILSLLNVQVTQLYTRGETPIL